MKAVIISIRHNSYEQPTLNNVALSTGFDSKWDCNYGGELGS